MKKNITFAVTLLFAAINFAQNGINYKAIVKDGNGNILASSPVTLQFTIYQGAALSNNVYEETHTTNTDANGLVILNIGEGTTADIFEDIAWETDNHYLNVQVNTGSGLVDLGTTQFKTVPYALSAGNVSGLEAINEGNGIGWRLKGTDPANYGNIGENAVDLSDNNTSDNTAGALGINSIAMGVYTKASGPRSIAMGTSTEASGNNAIAMGTVTLASGNNATAMGTNTAASGILSTAIGYFTNASGQNSIAMGNYIEALSYGETVIGQYNTNYTPNSSNSWEATDRLFVVGNGTSDGNRSDALTVLKNGQHIINSEVGINGTPTARLHVHQQSQSVGTGLRFSDNTANQDWDVTHGFSLRFHYGGSLRGFINANTGAYTQSSDASLKSNVQDIPVLMDRVKQLRPMSYHYKDDKLKTKTLGFIAQEVQSIFPEVVHFSENDGLYGIDYAAFGIIAVKAIQEQQTIIENQQKQIDELKTLILTELNKD